MTNIVPAISLLSLSFGIHIIMVNLDMGLSVIIPFMKRWGEKNDNQFLIDESRKYMRYVAITYATAGVMATAFTVFILSFFPDFIWIGAKTLMYPFILAVIFVSIRLFSITAYWNTWDKLEPKWHFRLGLVLASTSFLVPFAFRTVFGFFNNANAIVSIDPLEMDISKFFTNSTFWPLYFKSMTGAFAMTLFVLLSALSYRMLKATDPRIKEETQLLIKKYLKWGFIFLSSLLVIGLWYLIALAHQSPYKFSNVAGRWIGDVAQGTDYSWLFTLKMIFVLAQFVIAVKVIMKFEEPTEKDYKYMIFIGPFALLTILVGELLNSFSNLPYFVANKEVVDKLSGFSVIESLNPLADAFDVYVITVFAIVPLLITFLVLLYYVLTMETSSSD